MATRIITPEHYIGNDIDYADINLPSTAQVAASWLRLALERAALITTVTVTIGECGEPVDLTVTYDADDADAVERVCDRIHEAPDWEHIAAPR